MKQVLYAWHGYLFNAQRKKMYGLGGDGKCPLCRTTPQGPTTDSGPHILGGCTNPVMHGMYISRHNEAVRTIADCLHEGQYGGGVMVMDAGAEATLPEYCVGSRPPPWLFSRQTAARYDISKMRPDILFIPNLPKRYATRRAEGYGAPLDKARYPIYLLEVGYTSDLNHDPKQTEKSHQHSRLKEALEADGWIVHYTPAEVVVLGTTGTVPSNMKRLLQKLGAAAAQATRCCTTLHRQAIARAGAIIKTRRVLEGNMGSG